MAQHPRATHRTFTPETPSDITLVTVFTFGVRAGAGICRVAHATFVNFDGGW
jgi:hypothetical protein